MDFMIWSKLPGLAGGVFAIASGVAAGGVTLLGQLPPVQATPQQIDSLTTAIGGGAIAVIFYGVIQILTVVGKPLIADRASYWADKQKVREYEERKLKHTLESEERRQKFQAGIHRNTWNSREMYEWIVKAAQAVPELPKPPEWIETIETDERKGGK